MTTENMTGDATFFPAPRSLVEIPQGKVIAGLEWQSEQIPYPEEEVSGDTFPLTWAADDGLYTSACDPLWRPSPAGLDNERIRGDAPSYTIEQANPMEEYTGWGGARLKTTGSIAAKRALYLTVQNLTAKAEQETDYAVINYGHGCDAHIVCSRDYSQTWTPALHDITTQMFPGRTFASPTFLNFGKENAGARDSYVYPISGEGWDNGNCCRLTRVPADQILNRASWEWASGLRE